MFERDIKSIGKHINNALKEELSGKNPVVAKFATTASANKKSAVTLVEYGTKMMKARREEWEEFSEIK